MGIATSLNAKVAGIIKRILPTLGADNSDEAIRLGSYGEQYGLPIYQGEEALVEEGSRFVCTNPTIGTGVAHAQSQAYSATVGLFAIINSHTTKNLWVKRLRLLLTAIGTASVTEHFLMKIDSASRFPALPTGAVALTPVNLNQGGNGQSFSGTVYAFTAAAITLPAEADAKTIGRVCIPTGIKVVGDVQEIQFGGADDNGGNAPLTAIRATQPARFVANCGAFCIPPGKAGVIHRWALTESGAPSYEYQLDMVQR
jgi:hypothetical protein